MRKRSLFVAILSFVLLSTSCHFHHHDDDGFFDCERGTGNVVFRELNVSSFSGIDVQISADVFLYAGEEQIVEVEGQKNIIDLLEEDVRDGIWDIEFSDCVRSHDQLIFHITLPYIDFLRVSGSSRIKSDDEIVTDFIYLDISGSGDLDLIIIAEDIEGKITGSGKMKLAGVTETLKFQISGSGDLRAFPLISEFAEIEITGSGDIELTALEELYVRITGSGDVYYRGFPLIEVEISGSGNLINDN